MKPSILDKQFNRPLYEILRRLDTQIVDLSEQLNAVNRGEAPGLGGTTLASQMRHHDLLNLSTFDDHPQYLYLGSSAKLRGSLLSSSSPDYSTGQNVYGDIYFRPAASGVVIQEFKAITNPATPDGFCWRDDANNARVFIDLHDRPAGSYVLSIVGTGSVEMVDTATAQELANKTLTSGNLIKTDGTATYTLFEDPSDPSKRLGLILSGISTSTIHKWTAANWDGTVVAPVGTGTSGYLLISQGASQPIWQSAATAVAHNVLSATHLDSTPASVVRGDIITGQLDSGSNNPTAWGDAGNFIATADNASGSSWASIPIATSASITDGIILVLTTDNFADDTGNTNHHTGLTDTKSNTWTKVYEYTGSFFAGARGVCISIWTCVIASALTAGGDTLTATFSGAITAKAIASHRYSLASGAVITLEGTPQVRKDQNSDTGSLTISGLTSREYLFIRATGVEDYQTAYTPTTNYTAFGNHSSATVNTGTVATSLGSRGEYRILTATGDSTDPALNITNLPNDAAIMVALRADIPVAPAPKWTRLAVGGASTLFKSDGTDPSWGTVTLLSAFHSDTTPGSVARGDLITGQGASPTWAKLAKGTANQVLKSDGTDLSWVTPGTDSVLATFKDTVFRIYDDGDPTRLIAFEAGGITTGSTITLTVPDISGTLILSTSTAGQTIGAGAHTGGTAYDVAIEGRLLIGDNLTGINYTTGRSLHIAGNTANNTIFANISPNLASLSGAASGTITLLSLVPGGSLGYTSGSFTLSGFGFTISLSVPSGVTITELRGGNFSTAIATNSGTVSKITGLRTVAGGASVGTGTVPTFIGLDIQIGSKQSVVTNLSALNFSLFSTGINQAVSTFKLIDAANTGSTVVGASGNVVNWSGLYIPTVSGPTGNIWLLDLGASNSRLAGNTRFGGTTAPTNPVSITGAADISGIFDFASAPRLANGVWLTSFNSVGGTVNLIRYTTGNNTEVNSSNNLDLIVAAGGSIRYTATTGIFDMTNAGGGLKLKAGTTTAYPLLFQSGTSLTSPLAGAMEFTTDDFFLTITTGTARKGIVLDDGTRLTSGRVPFATTNGRLTDDADMTFSVDTLTLAHLAKSTYKADGIHQSTSETYISGSGTAGTDNTAQTIKTLTLPANSLTQVGDRIRVRTYFNSTGGSPITGSTKIGPSGSEVLTADTIHSGGASLTLTECWLHYIDNTHANIIEQEAGALGSVSAVNVAGFTWNADQNIIFTQNAVVGQHLTVYAIIVDILPKGI